MKNYDRWSAADLEFLAANLDKTDAWLAEHLERSLRGAKDKRMKLGLWKKKGVEPRRECLECGASVLARGLCPKHYHWHYRRATGYQMGQHQ